jgi:type VI secretion system secreted protein VgrG
MTGRSRRSAWQSRVGAEVIVDHEDGHPDRPIVVGCVYNGQNLPPTVVPTVSTLKSMTSPGDGTFNELTFDDTAGAQQIKQHTLKDWTSEVGNDHSETVVANSTSSVGIERAEATGVDRSTMVGNNNSEMIGNNEQVTIGQSQTVGIGADQSIGVGGNQMVGVGGNQMVGVGGNQVAGVTGHQMVAVTGDRSSVRKSERPIGS